MVSINEQHEERALALVGGDVLPRAVLHGVEPARRGADLLAERLADIASGLAALLRRLAGLDGGLELRDVHLIHSGHD